MTHARDLGDARLAAAHLARRAAAGRCSSPRSPSTSRSRRSSRPGARAARWCWSPRTCGAIRRRCCALLAGGAGRAPVPPLRGPPAARRWRRGRGGSPPHLREVMSAGEQLYVTPQVAALFAGLPGAALLQPLRPVGDPRRHLAAADRDAARRGRSARRSARPLDHAAGLPARRRPAAGAGGRAGESWSWAAPGWRAATSAGRS